MVTIIMVTIIMVMIIMDQNSTTIMSLTLLFFPPGKEHCYQLCIQLKGARNIAAVV